MSLLYGQLDEMDSSLDNLQAEVTDMAEDDELWTADDLQVRQNHLINSFHGYTSSRQTSF